MLLSSPTATARAAEIDQNTTLCLACSCSLPPLKKSPSHSSTSMAVPQIFLTPCCYRPICSRCIAANQRLQRYDPCLACLGGVGVVRSGSGTPAHQVREKVSSVNVDGAVRDEDTFVLGDADDDEEDDVLSDTLPIEQPERSHPAREGAHETASTASILALTTEQPTEQPTNTTPLKYYITRNDTLQGIALRYGLNVSKILPPVAKLTHHFRDMSSAVSITSLQVVFAPLLISYIHAGT